MQNYFFTSTQKVYDELTTLGDIGSLGMLGKLGALGGAIGKPLETYFPAEQQRLTSVFSAALMRFYSSKQHTRQKKQGGFVLFY